MPAEVREDLRRAAGADGITMTDAMLDALRLWFARREAAVLAIDNTDRLPLESDWSWLDDVAPWQEADNDETDAA